MSPTQIRASRGNGLRPSRARGPRDPGVADKPPLHTLPRDDLLAKLKSLTNLRAVRGDKSATGWTIELGPFPGWAKLPEW